MGVVLLFFAGLVALGAVQLGAMGVHAFENSRYYRGRRKRELLVGAIEHVTLFVPCKGVDHQLSQNLETLFRQDFPTYELCFVTESIDDPAVPVILDLKERYPRVDARLIYAGKATDSGQKVHNLQVATATVSEATRIMVFVDSDARVHEGFLSRMVEMLACGRCQVGTGYRWYVPEKMNLPNLLLAAINMRVATMMGRHFFNLIWGGAWIIWKETFHELGFPRVWEQTLSDDLVVSRKVKEQNLRVNFNPHCMVTSSADFTWSSLGEFLRRQFLVVRVYAPRWWQGALAANAGSLAILAGQLACAAYGATTWMGPIALVCAVAYYALTAARYAWAQSDLRPFVRVDDRTFRAVSWFAVLAWPLVSAATVLALLSAAWGRSIVWRGIHYRLDSASKTTILGRDTNEEATPPGIVPFPQTRETFERRKAA